MPLDKHKNCSGLADAAALATCQEESCDHACKTDGSAGCHLRVFGCLLLVYLRFVLSSYVLVYLHVVWSFQFFEGMLLFLYPRRMYKKSGNTTLYSSNGTRCDHRQIDQPSL